MNTALYRLAHRYKGAWSWPVPGFGNPARIIPADRSFRDWGAAFHWPCRDSNGQECVRGVDLDRHRVIARNEARALLQLGTTDHV